MKIGVFFDLHNTLTDSGNAWKLAFKELTNALEYKKIVKKLDKKESRKNICNEFKLDYQIVVDKYRKNLLVDKYGLFLLDSFSKHFEICLITNSNKEKALADLEKIGLGSRFKKIYTKENGIKPDAKYIEKIIKENNFDFVFMVGNDPYDDFIISDKVIPIIIDIKKCRKSLN